MSIKNKITQFHELLQKPKPSIAFILSIKAILFAYFLYNFNQNFAPDLIVNHFFIVGGDTDTYYFPLEHFSMGLGYDSACRMPGLLPIYAPIRLIFSVETTKVIIIILQFIASVISVRALALIAKKIFNDIVYTFTLVIYSLSIFVSIWDSYGLSDSFSISLLIFSIYYIFKFNEQNRTKYILLSGVFFAWALFFRPINLVALPVLCLHLYKKGFNLKNILEYIKQLTIFGIPLVLALSLWVYNNYKNTHQLIIFQDKMEACYPNAYPKYYQKLRDLSTSWGGDYQRTSVNGEMNWFMDPKINYKQQNPFGNRIYTSEYNIDSLIKLREIFQLAKFANIPDSTKENYIKYVSEKSDMYKKSYIKEHYFSYLITNRIRLFLKFCFPLRVDDIPFPAVSKMSLFQKIFKGSHILLLLIINTLGLFAGIILLIRREKSKIIFYGFPMAFLLMLSFYFGFIEMRYLAPVYPFFVIFSSYTIILFLQKIKLIKT